jgi:hypothetical protein
MLQQGQVFRLKGGTDDGLWHEHELSLRGRAFEQLVRAASLGQRQALGHDRVDLAHTQQLEQRAEVLPEPLRVAGAATHRKRSTTSHGKHLVALAQLLNPVGEHVPASLCTTDLAESPSTRKPVL